MVPNDGRIPALKLQGKLEIDCGKETACVCETPLQQTRCTLTRKVQTNSFCGSNWPVKSSASWKSTSSKPRM